MSGWADLADKLGVVSKPPEQESFMTYYAGESVHPQFLAAQKWFKSFLDEAINGNYHSQVMLAGGALRSFFTNTPVKDYDVYLPKHVLQGMMQPDFLRNMYQWKLTAETDRSWVYHKVHYDMSKMNMTDMVVNVIKTPRENLSQIIDRYDFTVCMCAISPTAMTFHPDYFIDLTTRKLRVHNPEDALSSLWRVQRYHDYGFTIDKEELFKICESMHEMDSFPTLVKNAEEKVKFKDMTPKTIQEIFPSS